MKRIDKKRFTILLPFILVMGLFFAFILSYFGAPRPVVSAILINQIYDSSSVKNFFDAFLNQDIQDVEIIVVNQNDADSLELETSFKDDKRFHFYEGTDNIAHNMNLALSKVKGKYLYIINPTFVPKPHQLKQQLAYFKTYPQLNAIGAQAQDITDKLLAISHSVEESQIRVIFQLPVEHYMTLIDADFVKKHHLNYDETLPALWALDFWQRFVEKGGKVRASYDQLFDIFPHQDHHIILDKITGMKFESDILVPSGDNATIKKVYQQLLSKYIDISNVKIDISYPVGLMGICQFLDHVNSKKYDFATLDFLKRRICKESYSKSYPIHHPQWHDTVVFDSEERLYLKNQGSFGSYQLSNDLLTIKWDGYGKEYFILNLNGEFVFEKNE